MKIDNKKLKEYYFKYLEDRITNSRSNCPSPKIILKSLRKKRFQKKKDKIIGHISCCYLCAKEFEFMLNTLRQEREFSETLSRAIKKRRPISSHLKWRYAFLLILLVIASLIGVHFISKPQNRQLYRGNNIKKINLIKPVNKTIEVSKMFFKWEELTNCDYYKVQIYDNSLLPIWISNKIKESHLYPPYELLVKLKSKRKYFWMVTAFFSHDNNVESPIAEFTIKK